MTKRLSDYVDRAQLKELMDRFEKCVPFGTAILETDGTILTANAWQDLCMQFHRLHPDTKANCLESDTTIAANLAAGCSFNSYVCKNGLQDFAAPIHIDGEHVANLFTGQLFHTKPDVQLFRLQAKKYGFDENKYLEAVQRVPVYSEETISNVMNFLVFMAEMLGNIGSLQIAKSQFESELKLARRIQTSVLPEDGNVCGLQICGTMVTASEVGGDYYNYQVTDDGQQAWFFIGDVAGHGLKPGMISVMTHSMLMSALQFLAKPHELIKHLNKEMRRTVFGRMQLDEYMTFSAYKYSGDGLFHFSGRHLDAIVYRAKTNSCEYITTNGMWINIADDLDEDTLDECFRLEIGDILVLYTDGITEARNARAEFLDSSGLMELIKKKYTPDTRSMLDGIIQTTIEWCDGQIRDDMTLMLIKRNK